MCVLEGGGGGGVSLWYLGDLYVRARVRAAQTVLNRYGGSGGGGGGVPPLFTQPSCRPHRILLLELRCVFNNHFSHHL